jgi:hypothetical protein
VRRAEGILLIGLSLATLLIVVGVLKIADRGEDRRGYILCKIDGEQSFRHPASGDAPSRWWWRDSHNAGVIKFDGSTYTSRPGEMCTIYRTYPPKE